MLWEPTFVQELRLIFTLHVRKICRNSGKPVIHTKRRPQGQVSRDRVCESALVEQRQSNWNKMNKHVSMPDGTTWGPINQG
mmetsp:Transcript_62126/g.145594  ORF Transcript_62126/g.145594 Transcript_62126/m.145594 type:complete len:81 (-) Transcript_62126:27-269(-)